MIQIHDSRLRSACDSVVLFVFYAGAQHRRSLESVPLLALDLQQPLFSLQTPPLPLRCQRLLVLPVRGRQQAPQSRPGHEHRDIQGFSHGDSIVRTPAFLCSRIISTQCELSQSNAEVDRQLNTWSSGVKDKSKIRPPNNPNN